MYFSNNSSDSSEISIQNSMSFLKKEKFALEIRSKIRENTFFQKRSNFKECSDKKLPEEIKKNEENNITHALHLLNALQNLIKSKTFIGIFPILEQIKSCIKADEIYQDILLKNNFIEIVFSLLEFLDSLNVYSRESVSILENISWLTINITAGDSKEESTLCIKHGLIQYYARIFANVQNLMTLELLENILWTFCNILEDETYDGFLEIHENDEIFSNLISYQLLLKPSQNFLIFPQFLMAFTHNKFFYSIENDSNIIAKLLQLISFCINNFPEAISNISKDDEDFLLFSFTSLLDLLNFLDQDEFFMTMQDNFELLLKILSLLQNYHSILMDPSKILAFWIEFIDRIEGEQQFWSLFELEKAFLEILQTKTHPLVIEKVIECVSLMIISANNGSKELFRIFNEVILNCFSSNNLQIKQQCTIFFYSVLERIEPEIESFKVLFEYFNRNQLYQEIISLLDCNIAEVIICVLKFIKVYLEMGELFAEEKNLQENICSIRIYVKEYGLLKIESLVLHTEDKIADLSNEILENYLNET